MDLKGFKNPASILRPAPFWAINSRITPEETARQIEDMISVGLSGAFFHSRHGLVTDYLSDEWFDAMNAAIKVANEKDGYVWLYDEDLWPSGNAGGQVAGMKDEYRSALLLAYMVAPGEPEPELTEDQAIRYCYAIKSREGIELKSWEAVALDKLDDAKAFERLFMVRTYTPKIGWWSGESYANLLDPEAMQQFMKLTHDVYLEKLGSEFGKRVPGIFTDEPQIANSPIGIAWYEGFPACYDKWTGRDFWADLPYMFFTGAESRKVRLLLLRSINRQFMEAYSKPIFEWCEKHGIEHTGHYNAEDSFRGQIACHAGSIMGHYRYQQAPGIDHLCRQINGMLFTVKQVSSAARQLGRTRVLDEIFGVSRHTNTFEDFKWLGDYDLVHGINFFVPHLALYSAKGRRKRDYPPNLNYQQTYWKELNPLNDYFTRIAHALTRGKAVVDVVMLHSIESATAAAGLGVEVRGSVKDNAHKIPAHVPTVNLHAADKLDHEMRKALEAILTAGYDCDLGDEGYIEDMGSVNGNSFVIGEMSYKVVVIPPSVTWRPRTFELVKQFADNGGKVVILGEIPSELDCDNAREQWIELAKLDNVQTIACGVPEIQNTMDMVVPSSFTLKAADGRPSPLTYVQHRSDGDQDIYFIVNSDRENTRDYTLMINGGSGKPMAEWDAVEGTCAVVEPLEVGNDLRAEFSLPPCGSILLTLGGQVSPCEGEEEEEPGECPERIIPLAGEFEFERSEENVLVLDRMSVSFDDGKTFEPEDLEHRVRRSVVKHFGTEPILDWQPWVAIRKKLFEGKGGDVVLRYKFTSDLDKPKAFAVIEEMSKGQLFVNGKQIDVSNASWHWDHAFGKVEITDYINKGENVMDFKVHYDILTEIEQAYIIGDFGVAMMDPFKGKIVEEPKKLKAGTWTNQGYPFYVGRMNYKTSFDAKSGAAVVLRLVKPSGILYKVRVNSQDADKILWRPYELDLSQFVNKGKNTLEIEVISSKQNAFGPLHEKIGDDNQWCGPNAFEDDSILREETNLFPYGLLGGAELVIF
ncbi:MAG: hypothetical protein ABFD54_09525 [Armatimonadota bacterium]|nr:hypothetical protein [bacterium]